MTAESTSTVPGTANGRYLSSRRFRLAVILAHVWVALLPIQMPLLNDGDRPVHLAPSDLVLALALLLTVTVWQIKPRVWSVWHFALPAMMILNLLAIGIFNRYTIFNKVVGILVLVAAYFLLTTVANSVDDVKRLVRTFVVSATVINLVAMVSHFTGVQVLALGCNECLRFQGFFPDPNLYGSILVVAWAFIWGQTRKGHRFISGPIDLLIQVSLLFGIIITVSRGTWIAFAVALLVGLVLKGGFSVRGWVALSLLLAAVIFLFGDQLTAVGDLAGRTNTIDSRWVLIEQGLASFGTNPVAGVGLGNFVEEYGQIIHNTPLWIAAEFGVIGIAVFTGFMLWIFKRGWICYRRGSGVLRGLAIGLLLGNLAMLAFSLSVEALYQRHWWFLFAMTAATYSFLEDESGPKSARVSLLRST